ncbi:MAG: hypothetical protein ACOCUS_03850 [Polyangiales bacterium]
MRRPSLALRLGGLALLMLAVGCSGSEGHLLAVQLATDLAPGESFAAVETTLLDGSEQLARQQQPAFRGDDLFEPAEVASFEGVATGSYTVRVALMDDGGGEVVDRTVRLRLEGSQLLTVTISSSCVDVSCPREGDPEGATTCVAGRCVPPECSEADPSACPASCESDADCGAGSECGRSACVGGVCLGDPGACDDGNECTADECVEGRCENTPLSDVACDDGVFCNGPDSCLDGACTEHGPAPCPASLCDEASGTCDSGCANDADCPDDVVSDWSTCGGFEGTCDTEGTRTRTVTSFTCEEGACEPSETGETESCTRTTEGDVCSEAYCSDWGDCVYEPCATDGSRSRRCYEFYCSDGGCDRIGETESEPCSRPSQDGEVCYSSTGCQGQCSGDTCTDLCEHCGGVCTFGGCSAGSC